MLTGLMLTIPMTIMSYSAAADAPAPVPVILDTDIGDDIDDTWALMMALGAPQIDLQLVTIASDDTHAKTRLTAKMLERVGRTDVPIGTGPKNSDREINQARWLGDYSLDSYPGMVHEDGVQALIDAIHASERKVTLLVTGPMTNIKAALERDPAIAKKARFVCMAGSVDKGYGGQPEPSDEWNVRRDIPAAQAVFDAPWEIAMAPLDVTGTLVVSGGLFDKLESSTEPRAQVLIENYDQWTHRDNYPANASSALHDTVAAYLVYDDAYLRMATVKLRVDDEGYTRRDPEDGRPVRCALDWKEREAFLELVVSAIIGEEVSEDE